MPEPPEINIKINAETTKAEDNAARLADALNLLQERMGEDIEKLRQLDESLMSCNDKLTETSVKLGGSEDALDAFGVRMESTLESSRNLSKDYEELAKSADKLAESLRSGGIGADEAQQQSENILSSFKTLRDGMSELGQTARKLNDDMTTAQQALSQGAFSQAQTDAVAKLNEEIQRAANLLRQMRDSGSDTLVDVEGVPHSLHEVAEELAKLKAAKDAISEGDTSGWLDKWASETKDKTDEIVAAYDKAAAKEAAAHAKAEAAAEKKLEKIAEANELESATIEELTDRLEKLTAAREAAQQAGDTVEEARLAESIQKTTAELNRKQAAYDKAAAAAEKAAEKERLAAEKAAAAARQAAEKAAASVKKGTDKATVYLGDIVRSFFMGTMTVRGFATALRGMGAALKAGLGPIGWGIILCEGLIWVMQKVWYYLKGIWTQQGEVAQKAQEEQQAILDKAIEAAEKSRQEYEGFIAQQREKDTLDALERSLANVNNQLKDKIAAQERSLSLAMQEAAFTQTTEELTMRHELARLARQKEDGTIDEDEYLDETQRIERSMLTLQQQGQLDKLEKPYETKKDQNTERVRDLYQLEKEKGTYDAIIAQIRTDEERNSDEDRRRQLNEEIRAGAREETDGDIVKYREKLEQMLQVAQTEAKRSEERGMTSRAERWQKRAYELEQLLKPFIESDKLLQKNTAEIDAIRQEAAAADGPLAEALSKSAKLFESQLVSGKKTTVTKSLRDSSAKSGESITNLQSDIAKAEQELDDLAGQIAALKQNQSIQHDILGENQEAARTRLERQRQAERDRKAAEEKRKAEEEGRRQQQEAERANREAISAQDMQHQIRNITQGYEGDGSELLHIFNDGRISPGELASARELATLSEDNKQLREMLAKLLPIASRNEQQATKARADLLALQRQVDAYIKQSSH